LLSNDIYREIEMPLAVDYIKSKGNWDASSCSLYKIEGILY
jgi:hypothetical protein